MIEFTGTTIAEGKAYLKEHFAKGATCPCCRQFVKEYRRAIHSGMVITLIELWKITELSGQWIHVKEFLRQNGKHNSHDWTLLQHPHWSLLEQKQTDPGEPSSGMWKITARGFEFIAGRLRVNKYGLFYNQKCYGSDGPEVDIHQALGTKFDLKELLNK